MIAMFVPGGIDVAIHRRFRWSRNSNLTNGALYTKMHMWKDAWNWNRRQDCLYLSFLRFWCDIMGPISIIFTYTYTYHTYWVFFWAGCQKLVGPGTGVSHHWWLVIVSKKLTNVVSTAGHCNPGNTHRMFTHLRQWSKPVEFGVSFCRAKRPRHWLS